MHKQEWLQNRLHELMKAEILNPVHGHTKMTATANCSGGGGELGDSIALFRR